MLHTDSTQSPKSPLIDGTVLRVLVAVILVWCARSVYIAYHHSPNIDAPYHLVRGYASLTHNRFDLVLSRNDGALGQMIMALPLIVLGVDPSAPIVTEHWGRESIPGEVARSPEDAARLRSLRHTIFFGSQWSPQFLHMVMAAWKTAISAVIAVGAFAVIRRWASPAAAWLILLLLTVEPNVIAHNAVLALDGQGAFSVLLAVLAYAHDLRRRSNWSLATAALATTAALLTKHTAVFLPGVYILLLIAQSRGWLGLPPQPILTRAALNRVAAFGLLTIAFVWPLLLFEVSRPMSMLTQQVSYKDATTLQQILFASLELPWPAGTYIAGLYHGLLHNTGKIPAFLMGEYYNGGRWYYFPLITLIKSPLPLAGSVIVGLIFVICRWGMIATVGRVCFIAAIIYLVAMMSVDINTGFRHFLPAYVLLMAAGAFGLATLRWHGRWAAAAAVALGGLHAASFGPDYLSYFSIPISKPHMVLSDSNIYWSQSAKQVGEWVRTNVPKDQTVYFVPFWENVPPATGYYLPANVVVLTRFSPPPSKGLILVSAVAESGPYDVTRRWHFLWPAKPIATIGHAVFVYDMEQLAAAGIKPREQQ